MTDIITSGDMSENDLLAVCASIERLSEHPLARAIVGEAEKRNETNEKRRGVEKERGRRKGKERTGEKERGTGKKRERIEGNIETAKQPQIYRPTERPQSRDEFWITYEQKGIMPLLKKYGGIKRDSLKTVLYKLKKKILK